MADQDETTVRHSCRLPEGCMPISVVEMVEFIDPEGQRQFVLRHSQDSTISTVVGLLDMAKYQVLKQNLD